MSEPKPETAAERYCREQREAREAAELAAAQAEQETAAGPPPAQPGAPAAAAVVDAPPEDPSGVDPADADTDRHRIVPKPAPPGVVPRGNGQRNRQVVRVRNVDPAPAAVPLERARRGKRRVGRSPRARRIAASKAEG